MSNKRPLILFTIVCLLSAAAACWGRGIPFAEQWPFYEALRTTAAIVFGVMGAWVTIIYPKALESILKRDYVSVLLKHMVIDPAWLPIARGGSFGLLVGLTLAEMAAVILTLWPIDSTSSELKQAKDHQAEVDDRFKLVQKQ